MPGAKKRGTDKSLDGLLPVASIFGNSLAGGARCNKKRELPYPEFIEDALQYIVENGMSSIGVISCNVALPVACLHLVYWAINSAVI